MTWRPQIHAVNIGDVFPISNISPRGAMKTGFGCILAASSSSQGKILTKCRYLCLIGWVGLATMSPKEPPGWWLVHPNHPSLSCPAPAYTLLQAKTYTKWHLCLDFVYINDSDPKSGVTKLLLHKPGPYLACPHGIRLCRRFELETRSWGIRCWCLKETLL